MFQGDQVGSDGVKSGHVGLDGFKWGKEGPKVVNWDQVRLESSGV